MSMKLPKKLWKTNLSSMTPRGKRGVCIVANIGSTFPLVGGAIANAITGQDNAALSGGFLTHVLSLIDMVLGHLIHEAKKLHNPKFGETNDDFLHGTPPITALLLLSIETLVNVGMLPVRVALELAAAVKNSNANNLEDLAAAIKTHFANLDNEKEQNI